MLCNTGAWRYWIEVGCSLYGEGDTLNIINPVALVYTIAAILTSSRALLTSSTAVLSLGDCCVSVCLVHAAATTLRHSCSQSNRSAAPKVRRSKISCAKVAFCPISDQPRSVVCSRLSIPLGHTKPESEPHIAPTTLFAHSSQTWISIPALAESR